MALLPIEPIEPIEPELPLGALLATLGSHGAALGAVLGIVLEVCAKANPPVANTAASRVDVNALIGTPSKVNERVDPALPVGA
jgi:hypothetical protein